MRRKKYLIPDQKSVTYGISAEDIALICHVSLRTACRWKSGAVEMPTASKMILAGDLGLFDPAWTGWTIRGDKLVSPESWEITVNDVLANRLLTAQLMVYQSENRRLKEDLAAAAISRLDEQPTPDSWEVEILAG